MVTEQQIRAVCQKFDIKGEFRSFERVNGGHINTTYRVYFFRDGEIKDYILQQINTNVFKDPVAMMDNISSITEYIRAKIKQKQATAKRNVLHYSKTQEDHYYTYMDDGSFWRCCRFINGSVCFEYVEDLAVVEGAGRAFGEFQIYLNDYPVQNLNIVIPHFHNTIMRFEALREAIKENAAGRFSEVEGLIQDYFQLEEIATRPYRLQRQGVLPLRVTHNDTKPSNILFDEETKNPLSVIDLDTVMPGLVAFDFGDAIRVIASTAAEDERDLSKVALNMEKFEAFTKGFVGALGEYLLDAEKQSLALGAVAMTTECGIRFLTDYLNGDSYFRIHYPDQNLVRAKCHLKLAQDMVNKLEEMQGIVAQYCK